MSTTALPKERRAIQMKTNKMNVHTAWALSVALMLGILSGCSRREFRVELAPEEAIPVGHEVILDGRPVGKVIQIRSGETSRSAVLRITDPAAQSAMRVGVARETRGDMRLTTVEVKADSPPLEPGMLIPTRSLGSHLAKRTLGSVEEVARKVRDFVVDHPMAAAACLVIVAVLGILSLRLVFTRCWLIVLFGLLIVVGSLCGAEPLGVTYSREFLRGEQTRATRLLEAAQRHVEAAQRLVDARSLPEAGAQVVRAIFALDLVEIGLGGHLDRVAAIKGAVFTYSKSEEIKRLTAGHQVLARQLDSTKVHANQLRERCATTPDGAPLLLVFLSRRESYREKIRVGLVEPEVVIDECRRLAAFPLSVVRQGLVTLDNAANTRMNTNGTVTLSNGQIVTAEGLPWIPEPTVADKASEEHEKVKAAKLVLEAKVSALEAEESARKAAPAPAPRIVTNTVIIVVTNEVRTIVPMLVTNREVAPNGRPDDGQASGLKVDGASLPRLAGGKLPIAPAAKLSSQDLDTLTKSAPIRSAAPLVSDSKSNIVAAQRANKTAPVQAGLKTTVATNSLTKLPTNSSAAGSPDMAGVLRSSTGLTLVTPASSNPPPRSVSEVQGEGSRKARWTKLGAGLIGLVMLVLIGVGVVITYARKGVVRVSLADAERTLLPELELDGSNLAVILQEEPVVALAELRGNSAAVDRDWLGRAVLLPGEGTMLNEVVVSGKIRLRLGDKITEAVSPDGPTMTWIFLGLYPAEASLTESPAAVPTH